MTEVAISCEGLKKSFGDIQAVDGVSFEVPSGSVLGLLGPNGAGKTTIVRILTTILRPSAGRATIMGRDVVQQDAEVRGIIGLAGQYAAVDELLTGRENLKLVGQLTHQPKSVTGPRAEELLRRFQLEDAADRQVKTYSGGMRRRLDLAASLVHKPPVLFLDEPTTGLDPLGRRELWGIIRELIAEGTTLLLTTQYLEEAEELADNIIVIDGGAIIAEGTATDLKQRLGSTIIEVLFSRPDDASRAAVSLASVGPSEVLNDGVTVELSVNDAGKSVLDVARTLDSASLVPDNVMIREPSLDDVFLQLTGHRAEPTDPVAAS